MDEQKIVQASDVTDFLNGFLSFIKRTLRYVLVSVKENIVIGLIVFVSICAIGIYYLRSKTCYESNMLCSVNNLPKKVYGEIIYKLNLQFQSKSYKQLNKELKIPEDQLASVIDIEAKNIVGAPLQDDFSIDKLPFYIYVRANDNSIFPVLQESLLLCLNDLSYQSLRREVEENRIKKKMDFLGHDMQQVDSIIKEYTYFMKNVKTISDSSDIFSGIESVFSLKGKMEDEFLKEGSAINFLKSVELIHGFMPTDKPIKKENKIWIVIMLSFFTSVVVCSGIKMIKKST